VVHIVTGAMTGWALVLAWLRRRYLVLAGTYLLAVLFHGLWNAITLYYSFASLGEMQGGVLESPPIFKLAGAAPYALVSLAILGLVIIFLGNRRLAKAYRVVQAEKTDSGLEDLPERIGGESML